MPAAVDRGKVPAEELARRERVQEMGTRGRLAVVQEQAAAVGKQVMANEGWLSGGFLVDERFTPQTYLVLAERQKALQRTLFALTECLLSEVAPPVVA